MKKVILSLAVLSALGACSVPQKEAPVEPQNTMVTPEPKMNKL